MSALFEEMREVGIVVGEATSIEFFFASDELNIPPKWEYLLINSHDKFGFCSQQFSSDNEFHDFRCSITYVLP